MSMQLPPPPPAGWYPDPAVPSALRFWDGIRWTEHVQYAYVPPVPSYNPRPFGGSSAEDDERYVTFRQAIALGFKGYAKFSGRSSRSEYWWWSLFAGLAAGIPLTGVLIWLVVSYFSTCSDSFNTGIDCHYNAPAALWIFGVLALLWALALVLPGYAVMVRRFHDYNKSGHFVWLQVASPLISLIPFVGSPLSMGIGIWFIVWCCFEGTRGPNLFGEPPHHGRERVMQRYAAATDVRPMQP